MSDFRWGTTILGMFVIILAIVATSLIVAHRQGRITIEGLPASPTREALVSLISDFHPEWKHVEIRDFFKSSPEPRSGILAVHSVYNDGRFVYRFATVRHDIICSTCTDLLLGVLFDPQDSRIIEIMSLKPWHLKAGVHDPTSFLRQFSGRYLKDSGWDAKKIEGVTGATYSVQATLHQLREIEDWIHSQSR